MAEKWEPSGLYKEQSRRAVDNGAEWWRSRGYEVRVEKVKDGWKHYRRKK
jgi:hypothetical protein